MSIKTVPQSQNIQSGQKIESASIKKLRDEIHRINLFKLGFYLYELESFSYTYEYKNQLISNLVKLLDFDLKLGPVLKNKIIRTAYALRGDTTEEMEKTIIQIRTLRKIIKKELTKQETTSMEFGQDLAKLGLELSFKEKDQNLLIILGAAMKLKKFFKGTALQRKTEMLKEKCFMYYHLSEYSPVIFRPSVLGRDTQIVKDLVPRLKDEIDIMLTDIARDIFNRRKI